MVEIEPLLIERLNVFGQCPKKIDHPTCWLKNFGCIICDKKNLDNLKISIAKIGLTKKIQSPKEMVNICFYG
jgi:hypothetical protein